MKNDTVSSLRKSWVVERCRSQPAENFSGKYSNHIFSVGGEFNQGRLVTVTGPALQQFRRKMSSLRGCESVSQESWCSPRAEPTRSANFAQY